MEHRNDNQRGWFTGARKSVLILNIFKALGITALAFVLSLLMVSPFSLSVMSLFSSPDKEDFTISDFYAQIADKRPVRTLNPDLIIVDIDRAGRSEITSLLETLQLCGPKVIALDVMFEKPGDWQTDSALIKSIREVQEILVMPALMAQTSEGGMDVAERSFFASDIATSEGAVNFSSTRRGATIREFVTQFITNKGDSVDSFALAIARKADPSKVTSLVSRGNKEEFIDYPSHEYRVINIADVPDYCEEINGKIVMIGAISDASDLHATPVNSRMPGVMIHAAALSTILSENYYTALTDWQEWLPALILCFLVVVMSLLIKPKFKGLLVRIVQVLLVYLTVTVGYGLFVDHQIILNAGYTLLMLGFGFFAVDIWNGVTGTGSWIIHKYKTRHKRKKDV